jgi:hypothetical protein
MSNIAVALTAAEKAEVVRDIYKKHAHELLTIEDAHLKLTLMLLGVFGAGASFLASDKGAAVSLSGRIGLSLVVAGILLVGWRYTQRRNNARAGVRRLLVQCEKALGLYEDNAYLPDSSLYDKRFLSFADVGDWLSRTYWIAALAAAGFLVVLWFPN